MQWDTPSISCRPPPVTCGPIDNPGVPTEPPTEPPIEGPEEAPEVIPTAPSKFRYKRRFHSCIQFFFF